MSFHQYIIKIFLNNDKVINYVLVLSWRLSKFIKLNNVCIRFVHFGLKYPSIDNRKYAQVNFVTKQSSVAPKKSLLEKNIHIKFQCSICLYVEPLQL